MAGKEWDKSKLPSRHVTEGPERAPHRSYYYAMGLSTKDIRKPFVGVGAGHVVGDDGLIALLSTRGFETRRIQ